MCPPNVPEGAQCLRGDFHSNDLLHDLGRRGYLQCSCRATASLMTRVPQCCLFLHLVPMGRGGSSPLEKQPTSSLAWAMGALWRVQSHGPTTMGSSSASMAHMIFSPTAAMAFVAGASSTYNSRVWSGWRWWRWWPAAVKATVMQCYLPSALSRFHQLVLVELVCRYLR